jgi:hypothetical protein
MQSFRFSLRHLLLFTAIAAAYFVVLRIVPTLPSTVYEKLRWKMYDSVQYQERDFILRITGSTERTIMLALAGPGSRYVYEVRASSIWSGWRTVCEVSLPSEQKIPRDQFKAVSDSVYYFYNSWAIGVTVDGGNDWRCIHVDSLPLQPPTQYSYLEIESLIITQPGDGEMIVNAIDVENDQKVQSTTLGTSDFGRTWSVKDQSGLTHDG